MLGRPGFIRRHAVVLALKRSTSRAPFAKGSIASQQQLNDGDRRQGWAFHRRQNTATHSFHTGSRNYGLDSRLHAARASQRQEQQDVASPRKKAPPPFTKCRTVEAVLRALFGRINNENIGAQEIAQLTLQSWNKIERILHNSAEERQMMLQQSEQDDQPLINDLLTLTIHVMNYLDDSMSALIANRIARLQTACQLNHPSPSAFESFWRALEAKLIARLDELEHEPESMAAFRKPFSMLPWSFAKVGYGSEELWERLAKYLMDGDPELLRTCNSRSLASMISAFPRVEYTPPKQLLDAAAAAKLRLLEQGDSVGPQDLATLNWAMVTLRYEMPDALMNAMAAFAKARLDQFAPHALSMLLKSVGSRADYHLLPQELVTAVAYRVSQDFQKDNAQHYSPRILAVMARAFSTLLYTTRTGVEDRKIVVKAMKAIEKASIDKLDFFRTRDLSMLLWSFGTARSHIDTTAMLFAEASRMFTGVHGDTMLSHPPTLISLVVAYFRAGHDIPDAILDQCISRVNQFGTQGLAKTAWAVAKTRQDRVHAFLDAVSKEALSRLDDFEPLELSCLTWAMASSGSLRPHGNDTLLFEEISKSVIPRLEQFEPEAMACLAWSFAKVGHTSHPFLDELGAQVANRLDEFINMVDLCHIAWAFAVFDHEMPMFQSAGADSSEASPFVKRLLARDHLPEGGLIRVQLHQWLLWRAERQDQHHGLPPHWERACADALAQAESEPSKLQRDVALTFKNHVSNVVSIEEEVRLPRTGYTGDIIVTLRKDGGTQQKVIVEVDGPLHFAFKFSKRHQGRTLLKHRQLQTLEHLPVIAIPFWEWSRISAKDRDLMTEQSGPSLSLFSLLGERHYRRSYLQDALDRVL